MDREQSIWEQFVGLMQSDDSEIALGNAALLIAATEYPNLDIDRELAALDSLSAAAAYRLGEERDPLYCVNTLNEYLFDEVGFRGNDEDYYDPRNSYLNDVLSRRLGIPIMVVAGLHRGGQAPANSLGGRGNARPLSDKAS